MRFGIARLARIGLVGLALAVVAGAGSALAQEGTGSTEERLDALERMLREQQKTIDAQSREIDRLRAAQAVPPPAGGVDGDGPGAPGAESPADAEGAAPAGEARRVDPAVAEQVDEYLGELGVGPADVVAGWKDGFFLATRDGEHKLGINGFIHADFRLPEKDHPVAEPEALVRRLRVDFSATLFDYYKFKATLALDQGNASLADGWMGVEYWKEAKLRVGQFKEPFGLEELTSDKYVYFVERSLPIDNLAPSRDVGAMIHGSLFDGILDYQVGGFNGAGQNNKEFDSEKEIAARIVLRPLRTLNSTWLSGLHLGFAWTYGEPNDENIGGDELKTAIDTAFFQFANGVLLDGTKVRYGLELAWQGGPVSLSAEAIHVRQKDLKLGNAREDLDIYAAYVTVGCFLTGEFVGEETKDGFALRGFGKTTPNENFDPFEGGIGAIQLSARVGYLRTEASIVNSGFATGTDLVVDLTVGLNWHLNRYVLVRVDYNRVWFDDEIILDGQAANGEDAILMRLQLEF